MPISIRLEGPFLTAEGSEGGEPVVRYRLKRINGAVTALGAADAEGALTEYRPGDLLTEDQAKGLALDYDVTTEQRLE